MKIDSLASPSLILQERTDRTGQNSLMGRVLSVKNEQVRLDGNPSCGSSVKRTFASFFNKSVRVCKGIPHNLALLVQSCYGTSTARTPVSVSTETYVNNQVNHHYLSNRNNHYDCYVLPIDNRETRPASQQYNRPHLLNQVSDGEHKTPKPPVAAPRTFKAAPRTPKAAPRTPKAAPRTLKPAPLPAGASGQNDIVYAELDLASQSKYRTVSSSLTYKEKTIYATIQNVVLREHRPSLSKT